MKLNEFLNNNNLKITVKRNNIGSKIGFQKRNTNFYCLFYTMRRNKWKLKNANRIINEIIQLINQNSVLGFRNRHGYDTNQKTIDIENTEINNNVSKELLFKITLMEL